MDSKDVEAFKALNNPSLPRDEVTDALDLYFGGTALSAHNEGLRSSDEAIRADDEQQPVIHIPIAALPPLVRAQRDLTPPHGIPVTDSIKVERKTEDWLDFRIANAKGEIELQGLFMARGIMNPRTDAVALDGEKEHSTELLRRVAQKASASKQARRRGRWHLFGSRGQLRSRKNITGQTL